MRSNTLDRLIDLLNKIDPTDYVKVIYDETLNMVQRGKIFILMPIQGLIVASKRPAVLYPEDLVELINNLVFLRQYDQDYLIAPRKLGFRVYTRDLRDNFRPKILFDLDFYSYKSRLAMFIAKVMNGRVKRCMKY